MQDVRRDARRWNRCSDIIVLEVFFDTNIQKMHDTFVSQKFSQNSSKRGKKFGAKSKKSVGAIAEENAEGSDSDDFEDACVATHESDDKGPEWATIAVDTNSHDSDEYDFLDDDSEAFEVWSESGSDLTTNTLEQLPDERDIPLSHDIAGFDEVADWVMRTVINGVQELNEEAIGPDHPGKLRRITEECERLTLFLKYPRAAVSEQI